MFQTQIGRERYSIQILNKKSHLSCFEVAFKWWRGQDSNLRPSGYEPDELPAAPPRDLENEIYNLIGTKVNTFL